MKFDNSLIEKEYRKQNLIHAHQRLKISCFLGAALILVFSLLDWFYVPELDFNLFLGIRVIIALCCALILAIAYLAKDFSTKKSKALNAVAYMSVAMGITVMVQMLDGYASPYYVGVGLVLLFAGQMAPFSFKEGLVICSGILGYYYFTIFYFNEITNLPIFLNNSFFIITIAFVSIISLYLWEQLYRKEFLAQYRLNALTKNLDRKVKQRTQELEQSVKREKQISNFKDQFLTIASHQLRTPVTALNWFLEQAKQVGTKKRDQLLKHNIRQLNESTDDLLIITELGLNYKVKHKNELELTQLINDVLIELKNRIQEKNVEIKIIPDDQTIKCKLDLWAMEIALKQIIENAIIYSQEKDLVEIKLAQKKDKVIIKITDQGIGIPQRDGKKVFTKFFRADNALQHHPIGTGLGLFISDIIIKAHHGKIRCTSREEQGTTFTIELPKN